MHPTALEAQVMAFDRILSDKQRLAKLSLAEAEALLADIRDFQNQVFHLIPPSILTDAVDPAHLSARDCMLSEAIVSDVQAFDLQTSSGLAQDPVQDNGAYRKLKLALVAGYRVCSDLSEYLMMRGVDILQDKQHSIDFLNQQLRYKIRDQHIANRLVRNAQHVRNQTHRMTEASGLGTVL